MTTWPKLAALAVVFHDDMVMLVQRRNEPDAGLWGYPGGHVEAGETALQAATRELLEETSIVATPTTYLMNLDIIHHDANGALTAHFLLAAVLCRYNSGQPRANDDVHQAKWVSIDAVLQHELPMSKDVDTILHRALEILNRPKPEQS